MELKIGDKYQLEADGIPFTIEIVKMDTREVTTLAAGEQVINPDRPRIMPIGAFAMWLNSAGATKLQ